MECKYQKSDSSDGCLVLIFAIFVFVWSCETHTKTTEINQKIDRIEQQLKK